LGRIRARKDLAFVTPCKLRVDRVEKKEQEMLAARIVMGVAVVNLFLLFSALAMNVARVYFG
jgi:hypothetical protein